MTCKHLIKYLPFYAVSILPMSLLYSFSDMLYVLVYHILGYRKNVVQDNIKKSFPYKSRREIKEIEKKFYHHFCDLLFEVIKSLTITPEEVKKRLRIRNPGLLEKYLSNHRDILLYTAHQGNWEWLIFIPLYFPYRSNTFYRPQKNKYFNDLLKIIRQRFGVHLVEERMGYKTIVKLKSEKIQMMNCIIGDQSPTKKSSKYWQKFLNRPTAFLVGADKIAKKTDQVVIFPHFQKMGRGRYELFFDLIEDNPKEDGANIVEKYAERLEKTIQDSPEMWLWSHRRWKLNS
ncbi:lysophospholipid acyltransferase family protein [Maribacter sp. 4G9]|uniref:lysophospholipid acyltransferase family protein n=1 Tax=Maribacter sp. 4G9 TaxID=1889777 RepID=UPI000C4B0011|nr:lysophospholipid acyltransferase family protein [Maribacter sp. 4G9]PIB27579.1 hypothetical protein BFP75_07195 [Maribacter sp. 4G9]